MDYADCLRAVKSVLEDITGQQLYGDVEQIQLDRWDHAFDWHKDQIWNQICQRTRCPESMYSMRPWPPPDRDNWPGTYQTFVPPKTLGCLAQYTYDLRRVLVDEADYGYGAAAD